MCITVELQYANIFYPSIGKRSETLTVPADAAQAHAAVLSHLAQAYTIRQPFMLLVDGRYFNAAIANGETLASGSVIHVAPVLSGG